MCVVFLSISAGKRVSPKKAGTMVHGEAGGEEQGSNGQVGVLLYSEHFFTSKNWFAHVTTGLYWFAHVRTGLYW